MMDKALEGLQAQRRQRNLPAKQAKHERSSCVILLPGMSHGTMHDIEIQLASFDEETELFGMTTNGVSRRNESR